MGKLSSNIGMHRKGVGMYMVDAYAAYILAMDANIIVQGIYLPLCHTIHFQELLLIIKSTELVAAPDLSTPFFIFS